MWEILRNYWVHLTTLGALIGPILSVVTMAYVLLTKKNSTSAVAWCLLVFFLPLFGPFLFLLFGYQHVYRPLLRKRRHKRLFQRKPAATRTASSDPDSLLAHAGDTHRSPGGRIEIFARLQAANPVAVRVQRGTGHLGRRAGPNRDLVGGS